MYNKKIVVGPDAFSTLDVCKICNIHRERLRDWINREYITPDEYINRGALHIAVFYTKKVLCIMLLKLLIEEGYTRDYASILLYDVDIEDIMELDYIQLSSQTDSNVWTTIEMDSPRKAVLKGIELLRGGE
jgi:hypothetical protein